MSAGLEDMIRARIEGPPDACWPWTGARDRHGYGRLGLRSMKGSQKDFLAHRFVYMVLVGPIPEGMEIHHKCQNRACVNPDHLEPLTSAEHAREHLPTHCRHGHEFTPENTYIYFRSDRPGPARACRACNRRAFHRSKKKRLAREAGQQ